MSSALAKARERIGSQWPRAWDGVCPSRANAAFGSALDGCDGGLGFGFCFHSPTGLALAVLIAPVPDPGSGAIGTWDWTGGTSLNFSWCERVVNRMWPGEMGIMSRKARTCGVLRIRWHCGDTSSGSGFEGMAEVESGGYAVLILQKGQLCG